MIPPREQQYLDAFVGLLKEALGGKLVSVVLYGSAARGDYGPGRSDINLLVVAEPLGAEEFAALRKSVSRPAFRWNIKPLFFTPSFLHSSGDVFPIEWKEIKEGYRVIHGNDLVKDLAGDPEHLRLQLEREAKQNLLKFRQGLVFRKDQALLLEESVKAAGVFLRHANECLRTSLETPAYMAAVRSGQRCPKQRLSEIICEHLSFLEKITELVNSCHSRG